MTHEDCWFCHQIERSNFDKRNPTFFFSTKSIIRIIADIIINIIIFSLTKHIIVCTRLENWHVEKVFNEYYSCRKLLVEMFVHISQDSDVLEKDDVN